MKKYNQNKFSLTKLLSVIFPPFSSGEEEWKKIESFITVALWYHLIYDMHSLFSNANSHKKHPKLYKHIRNSLINFWMPAVFMNVTNSNMLEIT